jgi:hypothetical protein
MGNKTVFHYPIRTLFTLTNEEVLVVFVPVIRHKDFVSSFASWVHHFGKFIDESDSRTLVQIFHNDCGGLLFGLHFCDPEIA